MTKQGINLYRGGVKDKKRYLGSCHSFLLIPGTNFVIQKIDHHLVIDFILHDHSLQIRNCTLVTIFSNHNIKHNLCMCLQVWFGDFMFSDNFQFYTRYNIPKKKTIDEYMTCIENMPMVDSPEAFGLHSNADIT